MPNQNCLAHGAIQASAKADNHTTAVTLILEHLWNTKFSCLLVAELFWTQGRRKPSCLNTLKIFFAQPLQEKPCQVMFVGTQHTREQQELNTREREGQEATKNFCCTCRVMHPIYSVNNAALDEREVGIMQVHPKRLSSHDEFHPNTTFIQNKFHPKTILT